MPTPKFTIPLDALVPKLLKLAETLDTKAEVAAALAKEHATTAGEAQEALKQERRSVSGREFANVCREAATRLREKKKVRDGSFVAPTLEEVIAFAAEKIPLWPQREIEKFHLSYEKCGWVIGKALKPMKSWEAAAWDWFGRWRDEDPSRRDTKQKATTELNGDPTGWGAFLKSISRRYEPHQYAMSFLQDQFRKQKAAK